MFQLRKSFAAHHLSVILLDKHFSNHYSHLVFYNAFLMPIYNKIVKVKVKRNNAKFNVPEQLPNPNLYIFDRVLIAT